MSKLYVLIAEGTEEVECLTTVDLLRRAGVEVCLVSITDSLTVNTSHNVLVTADKIFADCDFTDGDALFVPGGVPGVPNLTACEAVLDLIRSYNNAGKLISAVCAGPSVLGAAGILEGKKATCFPGWEDKLTGASYTAAGVTVDGNIITRRGLGFSIDLGLTIISYMVDEATALDIKTRIQHPETI